MRKSPTLIPFAPMIITGFAAFSMFFGAGNLIFPIELGKKTGSHVKSGLLGLWITGVLFTVIGLYSLVLYRGNIKAFFNRVGKLPGSFLSLLVLVMIGPLTGIPRSAVVMYEISQIYFPLIPFSDFIVLFLLLIFVCTHKRDRVIPLLGCVISPALVSLLLFIIIQKILYPAPLIRTVFTQKNSFLKGIKAGYATMDLMAALHFAPLMVTYMKRMYHQHRMTLTSVTNASFGASLITGGLLTIIYAGLCYIGAQYGGILDTHNPVAIAHSSVTMVSPWSAPALYLLMALAIISTALSLTTIFADFLHEDLFNHAITYQQALMLTLALTGFAAHGGLQVIIHMEKPFLYIFYPTLITLALCNILYKLWQFRPVKGPVLFVFIASIARYILR